LVLAGDSALDIEQARTKQRNVIGIDLNAENVRTFRQKGELAVCDLAEHQIGFVPAESVILDFKNGLTENNVKLCLHAMQHCRVVACSFLRGRESLGV
jgi:hypothetical protein